MHFPRSTRCVQALLFAMVSAVTTVASADPVCPPALPRAGDVCDRRYEGSRCTYPVAGGPEDVYQCVSMPGAPNSAHRWRRMPSPH